MAFLFEQSHDEVADFRAKRGVPPLRIRTDEVNRVVVNVSPRQILIPKGVLVRQTQVHANAKLE